MYGTPRQRRAPSMSPAAISARTRDEETGSPSTSTIGWIRVSNSGWAASISGVPRALAPKWKFSPIATRRAPSLPISAWSMNSSALRWENSSSKRITTISSTPSPSSTSRLTSSELISFGAWSGRSTSSGCGSKVRTVSLPSITARCPRWTPSKVPIATSRARGSTCSSGVTLIGISGSSQRVAHGRDQLGYLGHRHLAPGPLDPEWADGDAAQVGAVGVVERLDQGAHVGAGAALDLVVGVSVTARQEVGAMDLDVADRRLHHFAAVSLLVKALAADTDRGGHRHALAHGPGRQLERGGDDAGLGQLTVGVAGRGGPPQARGRQVGLRQADEEALQARRLAEQDEQQAGGEGIERARVARFLPAFTADRGGHVVRGLAGRLVDEQHRPGGVRHGHGSAAELGGDLAAEEVDERRQVVVGGEAGGALVAASPLLAGDRGDVDVPLTGAQAGLAGGATAVAEIADHGR